MPGTSNLTERVTVRVPIRIMDRLRAAVLAGGSLGRAIVDAIGDAVETRFTSFQRKFGTLRREIRHRSAGNLGPSGFRWRFHGIAAPARAAFLAALTEGATIADALKRGRFCEPTAYRWRERDPAFAESWGAAYAAGTGLLRSSAGRSGSEGAHA
jgi:hypothetical protein